MKASWAKSRHSERRQTRSWWRKQCQVILARCERWRPYEEEKDMDRYYMMTRIMKLGCSCIITKERYYETTTLVTANPSTE